MPRPALRLPALLLPLLLVAPALAGGVLGEAWEEGIERGLVRQRQEQRSTTADALVGKYERALRRQPAVENRYLLARAHGLRAAEQVEQAKARTGGEAARLAALAARDRDEARRLYADVLRDAPRCYFAHHDLGVLALQDAPPDEARAFAHFNDAYRIHPRYTPTLRQLVNLYAARKQHEAAVGLLRAILDVEGEDDEGRLRLAGLLGELGRHAEAAAEVERLLARPRPDPRAYLAQAQLDLALGRLDRASGTFRRLMAANPSAPGPYVGLLRAAQARREADPKDRGALEDALEALKGLYRLERDAERREALGRDLQGLERALAAPAGDAAPPPSVARALEALGHADERARLQAVLYLLTREEVPSPEEQREILRALSGRVTPAGEPAPQVRAAVVGALGRLYGTAWLWVTRKGLRDPDPRVVAQTADTLVGIARRDGNAQGAVVAALALGAERPDALASAACRLGVLALLGVRLLGVEDDAGEEEHRRAFGQWLASAVGQDRISEALRAYGRVGDPHAHEVLLPWLERGDSFVGRAAVAALAETRARVREDDLKAWYARLPGADHARLDRAGFDALKPALLAWAREAPSR